MNDKPCIPSVRSLEKSSWREWPHLCFFFPVRDIFIKQQISRKRVFSLIKEEHNALFIRRNRLYECNALTKGQYLYLLTLPKRFHKSISQNFIKILLYVILQDIFIPRSIPPGSNFIHLLFLLC